MNLNDTKSSETLRKEISQDLDRLDRKVDRLKDRMTPGQILDDAVFSAYRGNPRETFNYLKKNPVGSSFLAIGAILLMDNEGESYEQYLRSQGSFAYRNYREKAIEAKGHLGERLDQIGQDVRSKTQHLVEKGERGLHLVKEKSENIKQQVSSRSDQLKNEFGRRRNEVGQQVSENINQIGSEIRENISEVKDNIAQVGSNVIDATESFKERSSTSFESGRGISSSKINQAKDSVRSFGQNAMNRIKDSQMDSLGYVALGGTLGFVTGGLVPFSEDELSSVGIDFDFSGLRSEIEQAANESISIFKNEFLDTIKNSSLDIF